MQALESLNDSQVNDFLSGKSPLNLSVRLGDHMMLIQLQLSTINPTTVQNASTSTAASQATQPLSQSNKSSTHLNAAVPSTSKASLGSSRTNSTISKNIIDLVPENNQRIVFESQQKFDLFSSNPHNSSATTRSPTDNFEHNDLNSYLIKDVDNLESIVKSLSNFMDEDEDSKQARLSDGSNFEADAEQSPIKSLSNLVSNSITESTSVPVKPQKPLLPLTPSTSASSSASGSPSNHCSDQIDPNLFHSITSCLCKRLDTSSNSNNGCVRTSDPIYNPCFSHQPSSSLSARYGSNSNEQVPLLQQPAATSSSSFKSSSTPSTSSFLHKTTHNAIIKSKSRHGSLKKHHSTNTILPFNDNQSSSSTLTPLIPHTPVTTTVTETAAAKTPSTPESPDETLEPIAGTMDNPALAEASRNLTQTLRKLSKKVFPRGDGSRRITSGAVIESMKHHGKGIYSGTFSGTLNPALQDKHGRPKRDISTIIHILNDLLSAAPQCTRSGAKIYFEPTTSTGNSLATTGSQSAPASPVTKSTVSIY